MVVLIAFLNTTFEITLSPNVEILLNLIPAKFGWKTKNANSTDCVINFNRTCTDASKRQILANLSHEYIKYKTNILVWRNDVIFRDGY